MVQALEVAPFCGYNFRAQDYEWFEIVLLVETQEVLLDLWSVGIVSRPVWIAVEGKGVCMGRDIASAAWITVFILERGLET